MAVPHRNQTLLCSAALLLALSIAAPAIAQDEDGEPPRIAMAAPLAAVPGTTTQLTLRGWKLDNVTAVRPSDERARVKLGQQGPAPVPGGQNANDIGDKQVAIELELPAEFEADVLSLVAVTDAGESEPYELLVAGRAPVQTEQEPNNGFGDAQALAVPGNLDGSIQNDRDVDVFALEGQTGDRVICELIAQRRGSGCDGTLTLFDANRSPVAYSDDDAGSRDPRLKVTLPTSGRYYLVIADANDRGGPAHPYRLVISD